MPRSGPVVIAFDGTPASEHAIREGGPLLAGRAALVLVVWKQGLGFEMLTVPASEIGLPPPAIDVNTALDTDQRLLESAQRQSQRGAVLAREAGLQAEALVVADDPDTGVDETIVRVADERDAAAILMGAHNHGRIAEMLLGSTTRGVLRGAQAPVVVVRHEDADHHR